MLSTLHPKIERIVEEKNRKCFKHERSTGFQKHRSNSNQAVNLEREIYLQYCINIDIGYQTPFFTPY